MEYSWPCYTVIDISFGDFDASVAVMCNGKRFCIQILSENLREPLESRTSTKTSALEQEFLHFRDLMDDDATAMEAFEEWIMEPCVPYLRKLAWSTESAKTLTLEEYFDPVTFILTLVNVNGRLEAKLCPNHLSLTRYLTPKVSLSDRTVSTKLLQDVPRMKASQLEILPGPDPLDEEFCTIPKAVCVKDDGRQFFFKAAFERGSFTRELHTLLRIRDRHFSDELHVSKLVGLVEWSDGVSIMGFLLEYIEHQETLRDAVNGASHSVRERWIRQIQNTIKQLHSMELIWGDVKPDNVLIDDRGNAWVIDFGGGYSPDWVDNALNETAEGDLQGISRIKEFLAL